MVGSEEVLIDDTDVGHAGAIRQMLDILKGTSLKHQFRDGTRDRCVTADELRTLCDTLFLARKYGVSLVIEAVLVFLREVVQQHPSRVPDAFTVFHAGAVVEDVELAALAAGVLLTQGDDQRR